MRRCRFFPDDTIDPLIDFGPQPLTNRFIGRDGGADETHLLQLGISQRHRIVQQLDPATPDTIRARFSWIKYNEAEDHLDDLVARLVQLPGVTPNSPVVGLTYKDTSTLTRLSKHAFRSVRGIDAQRDLDCREPNSGLETIQHRVTATWADLFSAHHGRSDLVVARHVLEHSHNPGAFLDALGRLVRPGGYVVLEVPDSTTALASLDYTMPWEEHVFYFTSGSFRAALAASSFELVDFIVYPYALENSLVAILRSTGAGRMSERADGAPSAEDVDLVHRYAAEFGKARTATRQFLADYRSRQGKIAVLGAGHAACTYINLLGISDCIDFIVDDSAEKQACLLPGCRKAIKPSVALILEQIKLCLLSVNHNAEDKVVARNAQFVRQGGEFRSIFRSSSRCLPL